MAEVALWQAGHGMTKSIVPRSPAALVAVILTSALHPPQRMRLMYLAMP